MVNTIDKIKSNFFFEISGVDISASNIANDAVTYSDSVDLLDGSVILGFISAIANGASMASSSVVIDLQESVDNTNFADMPNIPAQTLNSGNQGVNTGVTVVGATNARYMRLKMTKTGTDAIALTIKYAISELDGVNIDFVSSSANVDDILDGTTSFTRLNVDNLRLDGNTISSTDTNGDINIAPNGSGKVVGTKFDINGGAIDGTTIGAATPSTVVGSTVTSTGSFVIGSADMDETDLEKLDGITNGAQAANKAVIADANVNTGVSKITELHIGATGAETQVTASGAELNYNDITTLGTAEASKVLTSDASLDTTGIRHLTLTGNLVTGTTTLSEADLAKVDGITNGTQAASKAVVADANVNTGISKVTELHIGATGSEVKVDATPAEINKAADLSFQIQTITASGAQVITSGVQTVYLNEATTAIAATIATAATHQGFFFVKAGLEPAGGQDHTVTLTSGTWNGTNNVATFADIADSLLIYFDASGNGTVLINTGAVAFS